MSDNTIDNNIDAIRSEFKLLDHWIYLNAADQMIPGNYWLSAARDFYGFQEYGRMEDIPTADIATHPFLMALAGECIERAARLINADKDEVTNCYRPCITANLIFYNMFEWRSGDNVVFTDLSYPSIPYILQDLRRRYGIELRVIKNVDGVTRLEDLEAAVDEQTRMVVIDRTAAFSGFTFDVKEVCRIAHAKGALVLDDAMQSLGAINVDVKDDDVDMLISGAYKWLCGPFGAAVMYLAPHLQTKLEPGLVGFRSHKNMWDLSPDRLEYPDTSKRFEFSTMAFGCIRGLEESIRYLVDIGIDQIYEHNLKLADRLVEGLNRLDIEIVSPLERSERTSIVTCRVDGWNSMEVVQKLKKRKIVAHKRQEFVRFSPHLFNSEADVDRAIAELQSLLKG